MSSLKGSHVLRRKKDAAHAPGTRHKKKRKPGVRRKREISSQKEEGGDQPPTISLRGREKSFLVGRKGKRFFSVTGQGRVANLEERRQQEENEAMQKTKGLAERRKSLSASLQEGNRDTPNIREHPVPGQRGGPPQIFVLL